MLKELLRETLDSHLESKSSWVATQAAPSRKRVVEVPISSLDGSTIYYAPEAGWYHIECIPWTGRISSVNVVSNDGEAWLSHYSGGKDSADLLVAEAFVQKGARIAIWVHAKSVSFSRFIPAVGSE